MAERGILQAEKRVREMNEMAQQYVRQSNEFMRQGRQGSQPRFEPMVRDNAPAASAATVPPIPPVSKEERCPEAPHSAEALPISLNGNGETLLILLIIYILMKEKADMKLILALAYLLL